MTREDIIKRIEHIEDIAGDDEMAHSEEDRLYQDVLESIAKGTCYNPQDAALLALSTEAIGFARWCA